MLAKSIYSADVILIDPDATDLSTFAGVRGTPVSYRYIVNMSICFAQGDSEPFNLND